MRTIEVDYFDLSSHNGPVPVVAKEDGYITWCGHVETHIEKIDIDHSISVTPVEVCHTCDAYRFIQEDWRRADEW